VLANTKKPTAKNEDTVSHNARSGRVRAELRLICFINMAVPDCKLRTKGQDRSSLIDSKGEQIMIAGYLQLSWENGITWRMLGVETIRVKRKGEARRERKVKESKTMRKSRMTMRARMMRKATIMMEAMMAMMAKRSRTLSRVKMLRRVRIVRKCN
jgi:hypothetical protein